MIEKTLNNMKNKIVIINYISHVEGQLFKLIEVNKDFLLVEHSNNSNLLINRDYIITITLGNQADVDKFYDYKNKFKNDPFFRGDEEKDKGYTYYPGRKK